MVSQNCCATFVMGAHYQGSLLEGLDGTTLRSIMEEVTDPRLRSEVLKLAQAAARADAHLAEGEAFVLAAARRYWSLSSVECAAPAVPD